MQSNKFARVIGGVAVETFTPPAGFRLDQCFHADVASQFVPVPEEVEAHWQLSDAGWSAPPPPAPSMEPPAERDPQPESP